MLYFTGITTYIYAELAPKLMATASVAQSVDGWSRDPGSRVQFPAGGLGVAFFVSGPGLVLKCISFWHSNLFIWEAGPDVCRDGTIFILCLKTDYMGGGTGSGCLQRHDAFQPRFYMRMFLPGTIPPGTICKVSIISSRQSGRSVYMIKIVPALAGIPVERTGSRFVGKSPLSRQTSFHINGMWQIRDIYMHGEIPFNVPSRQTSCPTSHINSHFYPCI